MPTFRWVNFTRVRSLIAVGAALTVLAGCRQLDAFRGDAALPQLQKAQELLAKKDRGGAIAEFDKAIAADPNNIGLYGAVISICARYDIDLVAMYGEKAISATSNAPAKDRAEIIRATAQAYLQQENFEKAVSLLESAYQLEPKHPAYLNDLAYGYAELHQDPDRPGALSKLHEGLRMVQEAISRARETGATDTELGVYMDTLGWLYYRLRKYREAVVELSRAGDLAPDQKDIHVHLALALKEVNRMREAITALKKARKLAPNDRKIAATLKEWETAYSPIPAGGAQSPPPGQTRGLIRSER